MPWPIDKVIYISLAIRTGHRSKIFFFSTISSQYKGGQFFSFFIHSKSSKLIFVTFSGHVCLTRRKKLFDFGCILNPDVYSDFFMCLLIWWLWERAVSQGFTNYSLSSQLIFVTFSELVCHSRMKGGLDFGGDSELDADQGISKAYLNCVKQGRFFLFH